MQASTFGGYFNNRPGKLHFASIVLLLLELFAKLLFTPSGLTEENQVSMGHYEEIFQSSTNESARKC